MSSNPGVNIGHGLKQSIVTGGDLTGNVTFNLKAPDQVTDTEIKEWLFEISRLQAVERNRTHSVFAGKLETYLNALKDPENSGRWLLEHPSFIAWRDGMPETRILWLYGKPGLGKSTLTSLIIKNLHSIGQSGANTSACLYVYFEREHRGQRQHISDSSQLHVSLIKNLLAQLVSQTTSVSQLIKEHYEKFWTGQGLTIQSALDLLKKEASSFGTVYIVVDALEKCDSGNSQASDENPRYAFLSRILNLGLKFRYLVVSTSRNDIITELLSKGKQVLISKDNVATDLKMFIRSRLRNEHQSKDDDTTDESFWNTCCDEIIQRSEGQYFHAKLLINQLFSKKRTLEDLKIKLADLPSAQDKIYKDSVHNMVYRDNNNRTQVAHILQWLTFAMRPLTLEELSCAISAPNIGHTSETDMKVLTEYDIHRMCRDFVVYDGETVSIVSSTAADFLEQKYFPDLDKNPELLIAEKCISYLSNQDLKTTVPQGSEKYPLFNYAAKHWHEHFVIANANAERSDLNGHVINMLSDEGVVTSIYNTMNPLEQEHGVTGLHLAALLNLGGIVDSLVNLSKARGDLLGDSKQHNGWLEKKTNSGETALHYAIRGTHGDDNPEMVRRLLCYGINPNIKSKDGQTALHQAIVLKRTEAALELASSWKDNGLTHPLLVDIPDKHGYTPLMSAAKQGMLEVTRALIPAGANVDARTEDGCSVLEIAANNNHHELVGVLLRRNAKTRSEGLSILHWAAEHGYQDIIWQLYSRGEDMNLVTSEGSPVVCAVRYNHGLLVWLLLSCGANLDVSGPEGNTALHTAVEKNAESIIWLLLESGANPNVRNKEGETPLHCAVLNDNLSAAWLLLHKGSKPELRNKDGDMPIHIAAREGAMSTARWLIEAGADVNAASSDGSGHTPLHIAAEQGRNAAEFIQFLVAICTGWLELDLNRMDAWNRTPLHAAVNSGNELAARVLLASGANPNLMNGRRLTPLHEAAIKEQVPVVKALLEYNADIMLDEDEDEDEDEGDEGYTVLEKAILRIDSGEEDGKVMLATLLHAGVNVTRQCENDGWTPLHFAANLGLTEAIKMMYDIAVPPPDLTIEDRAGRTAVQVGIDGKHEIDWKRVTWC